LILYLPLAEEIDQNSVCVSCFLILVICWAQREVYKFLHIVSCIFDPL
jgi:hypothetical protein